MTQVQFKSIHFLDQRPKCGLDSTIFVCLQRNVRFTKIQQFWNACGKTRSNSSSLDIESILFVFFSWTHTSKVTSTLQDTNQIHSIARLDGFGRVSPRAFQNCWVFVNWIFRLWMPVFFLLSASSQRIWFWSSPGNFYLNLRLDNVPWHCKLWDLNNEILEQIE